jgi:hypothetical protein
LRKTLRKNDEGESDSGLEGGKSHCSARENSDIDFSSSLDCKSLAIDPARVSPADIDSRSDSLSSAVSQKSPGYQEDSGDVSMVHGESADGRVFTGFSQHSTSDGFIGTEATQVMIPSEGIVERGGSWLPKGRCYGSIRS